MKFTLTISLECGGCAEDSLWSIWLSAACMDDRVTLGEDVCQRSREFCETILHYGFQLDKVSAYSMQVRGRIDPVVVEPVFTKYISYRTRLEEIENEVQLVIDVDEHEGREALEKEEDEERQRRLVAIERERPATVSKLWHTVFVTKQGEVSSDCGLGGTAGMLVGAVR